MQAYFRIYSNPFCIEQIGWLLDYSEMPGDPFEGKRSAFPGGQFDMMGTR